VQPLRVVRSVVRVVLPRHEFDLELRLPDDARVRRHVRQRGLFLPVLRGMRLRFNAVHDPELRLSVGRRVGFNAVAE